jgi:hypothetical protein
MPPAARSAFWSFPIPGLVVVVPLVEVVVVEGMDVVDGRKIVVVVMVVVVGSVGSVVEVVEIPVPSRKVTSSSHPLILEEPSRAKAISAALVNPENIVNATAVPFSAAPLPDRDLS